MVSIREAIVVEGRYDKNTLNQIVDAPVFQTDGFGVMKNRELQALLRSVAQKRGLIVFTDADGAGFVIRNFLKSVIPTGLKHAYTPDILGKERRKDKPGKEGKLGVEGMDPQIILDALRRAGATFAQEENRSSGCGITKADLVEMGLSGGSGSSIKRAALLKYLDFPEHMSANAMLQAINVLYTKEELTELLNGMGLKND